MPSFRERFRGRWQRGSDNVESREGDESGVRLRVEEGSIEPQNGSSRTSSLSEQRSLEESSADVLHFIVDFVGSAAISEAQSVQILSETLKRVKKQQLRSMRVDFTIRDGILKVSCVESNALLLTAPLYAIALCAQEQLRGFDNCFALNITRKRTHMCHVFQAGSCLEAASVVRSVAVAFKTIGRLLREKRDKEQRQKRSQSISSTDRTRTNSEASTATSVEEALRASQRRHQLFREKMDRESGSVASSSRKSPSSKQTRTFPKSGVSPSILRHTTGSHSSRRHVEFSALSPVPSDSSDAEGVTPLTPINVEPLETSQVMESESSLKGSQALRVVVDVHTNLSLKEKEQSLNTLEEAAKEVPMVLQEENNTEAVASVNEQVAIPKEPVSPRAALSLPLALETNIFLDEDENFKPALEAVLRGDVAAVEKYLDDGMSENASDNNQKSLLFHAVSSGQTGVAQLLLRRGAEVNWEGPDDKTPLHIAATEGNRSATQMLLGYGANVRAKDNVFCTPLHLSVGCKQNLEVSHLLVEHGARINDNNLQGIRPVDLEPQLKEMQRLLVQSACEAFTAADLSKSRSNSNTSSHNQSTVPGSFRSKAVSSQSPRLERINSLRNERLSSSMCSIPRGGMVRSNTESSRRIKRSESIHVSRMLSPQLGRGKRPSLRRSLSFQRCPTDHKFELEIHARIESSLRNNSAPDNEKASTTPESHGLNEATGEGDDYVPQVTKKRSNSDLARHSTVKEHSTPPKDVVDLNQVDNGLCTVGNSAEDGKGKMDGTGEVNGNGTEIEKKGKGKSSRQHSIESEHSGGGHHSSECEDSSYMSACSHGNRDEDPIIEALKSVVLLSGNPECHASLLAYLCLPRASSQLISLAHMPTLTAMVAENIAVLVGNLFNLEGPESRKRSVEAGLIKTVLKLVDGVEPIQSTCLSILHNILDFDNDREYSTALQSIPVEPLLNLLHISDTDSAFDMRATDSPPPYHAVIERGRRRKASTCSRGSHDDWHTYRELSPLSGGAGSVQRNNSGASDGRPEMRRLFQKRNSISSMASSVEGDQHSSYSSYGHGHLPWSSLSPDMHTKNLPRLVATKMLAATTMNTKMQKELGKVRPLTLMLETLQDSNQDIVVYTTAALANIAMNIENHEQMANSGCVNAVRHLLNNSDSRITYHAARCLIYLGHMDVSGIYLFKHVTREDKIDVIFADTTGSEHLYVKGATVEKIVEIATNNPSILWGGARLQPSSPKGGKHQDRKANIRTNGSNNKKATDDQIVDFILTMYPSFVHPIVFMRLLIHRFRDPWFDKYFDGDPATGQIEEYDPLPVVHIHLMRLWKTWLDKYPEKFIIHPTLAKELSCLFLPMRRAGGPYLPCAESLESLLVGLESYTPGTRMDNSQLMNHCHHSLLYAQCQKAIVNGGQPCQVDDAVYLSALQLYIEDLSPTEQRGRQWFFQGSSSPDKLPVSRIKQSVPHSMYKIKNIVKRIKAQRERFISENLSERNAKHNYIDCCQSIAGYGCRFFKLRECQGTNNKKTGCVNRLFGVNPNKVILLDEKSRSVVGLWHFKDIKRWNPSSDNIRLQVQFTNQQFEFLLENKNYYKEITELLFNCTRSNLEALEENDFSPWSKYAEDTETWGPVALAHETEHQIPENGRDDTDNGSMARSRAVSCISAQRSRRRAFQRHVSIDENYSTSAPFPGNNLGHGERGPVGSQSIAPVLAATASSISPLSGVSLQSTHHSLHSSDEQLIGSLHSTPATSLRGMSITSKCSWDAGTGVGRPKLDSVSRESEGSVDSSPTELHPLDPNLSLKSSDIVVPSGPPRHRYLSTGSPNASIGCPSPSYSTTEQTPTPRGGVCVEVNFDAENFNRMFGLSPRGQLLTCHCPPDALMPGFDRRDFTVFQLLEHPKELARQITAIDHEYFCAVTAEDIQKKVAMGTGKKRHAEHEHRLLVERVADRFNQLTTWVVASILTEESPEKRAIIYINFIETAKQCLEFRNFNAVMAIVAALGSAPIRRLGRTKEFVPKEFSEQFSKIEMLMDPKDNYKRYRSTLRSSPTPTVPYFGVYMKDLTFIAEGNADFLKGGLVNLTKRRQIYLVVNEIRKFQKKSYNFQEVTEVREFLLGQKIMTEEDLYLISRQLEPTLTRRHSEPEKDSRSSSIPQLTRSNTVSITTGKKLVKSLSLGEDSNC